MYKLRPTRRNILFPVSRPTHFFFKKGKKKKKMGRGFQMATPFFCNASLVTECLLRKDGRGLVIVRRPTDLQLRETVGIPETRYFFWLALSKLTFALHRELIFKTLCNGKEHASG